MRADIFASSIILDNRVGGRRLRMLLATCSILNLRELYSLSPDEFTERIRPTGLSADERKIMSDLIFDPARRENTQEKVEISIKKGIRSINCNDDEYPTD